MHERRLSLRTLNQGGPLPPRTMSAASKLELGSLKSYSPSWPFPVRLTLAIAVQYACLRCVQRAEAIHQLLNASTSTESATQEELDYDNDLVERDEDGKVTSRLEGWDRKLRTRRDGELVAAWREYCEKFLTATCQHLGVPEESLPRECIQCWRCSVATVHLQICPLQRARQLWRTYDPPVAEGR